MSNDRKPENSLPEVRGEYRFSEPLSKYTWLNVGGPAEVMFFPADEEDLQNFLRAKNDDLPVFVLGGGSNLLIRDGGMPGVVVKLKNQKFAQIRIEKGKIICGAGLLNGALKKILIDNAVGGLEFLCSIPGSLGGAVYSNAGCFGYELSDVLLSAKIIDKKGNIKEVAAKDFHLSYRHSDFPADWIILELTLKTEEKAASEITETLKKNSEYRRVNQPQGIKTAGSTFKNPSGYKAWELIKDSGADKITIGGAKMSAKHCNFIENDGTATASDIEKLCESIMEKVEACKGVKLELEVKKVGKE
ncbi:MAG: UDP-N-acetylmuramate dehydrogenase [Alphaproteobacteria bacterium]|nr:UDP-N-acetylmuramate dehydrogenase [Alphaproteobacteria bacterium]